MNNTKFKKGDRVKIIDVSSIERCELNKIGTIVRIVGDLPYDPTYIVDMGRPRRKDEPNETCWWLKGGMLELIYKPNAQLLFHFMY